MQARLHWLDTPKWAVPSNAGWKAAFALLGPDLCAYTGIQTMVCCIAEAWLDLGHPTNHALYSYLLSCLPVSTRAKYYSESPSSDPQPHQQGFNQNRRTDQLLRQHLGSAFARLVKCAHFPDDYSEPGQVMTCCSSQSNNKKDDDGLHTERRKGRHASLSA